MAHQHEYSTSRTSIQDKSEVNQNKFTTLDDLRLCFGNRCPACNRDTLSLQNGVNCFYCGAAQVYRKLAELGYGDIATPPTVVDHDRIKGVYEYWTQYAKPLLSCESW
jgi:hypothetical protein